MNENLIFNGIDSADFGIYISGEGTYNAPERAVEMITVPGRNGALSMDQGRFENILVTYPAFCWANDQTDFAEKVADFRNAILSNIGYKRLEDAFHPDEYRLGVYHSGLEVSPVQYNRAGQFSLSFDCKPQRFLKSGEVATTFTSAGTITNPTRFASRPLVEVIGYGLLMLAGYVITVTGTAVSDTFIDLETFEAYSIDGGVIYPKNSAVSIGNQSPTLAPGENEISFDSTITSVAVTPRWWQI